MILSLSIFSLVFSSNVQAFVFMDMIQSVAGIYSETKAIVGPFFEELVKTNQILSKLEFISKEDSKRLNEINQFLDDSDGDNLKIIVTEISDIDAKDIYEMKRNYHLTKGISTDISPWIGTDVLSDGEEWLSNIFSTADMTIALTLKDDLKDLATKKSSISGLNKKALDQFKADAQLKIANQLSHIKAIERQNGIKLQKLVQKIERDEKARLIAKQSLDAFLGTSSTTNYFENQRKRVRMWLR